MYVRTQEMSTPLRLRRFTRFFFIPSLLLFLIIPSLAVLLSAFEAHVVNVTATIERRPCETFTIKSLGFWKIHSKLWILPQTLGSTTIGTPSDAVAVFNSNNSIMANKLRKQLLALKFNIAYYSLGNALVPNESSTIAQLILEADAFLTQVPEASEAQLEAMRDRIEATNNAGTVSTCVPPCPTDMKMLTSVWYVINSSTIVNRLSDNVSPSDHVRVDFTLAAGCENMEFSLASYKVFTSQQSRVFDSATGLFGAGPYSMEVDVPACCFKIYFVKGSVIETLTPTDNYDIEERSISADRGNPDAPDCSPDPPPLSTSLFSSFAGEPDSTSFTVSSTSETPSLISDTTPLDMNIGTSSIPESYSTSETSSSIDVAPPPDLTPSLPSSPESSSTVSENTTWTDATSDGESSDTASSIPSTDTAQNSSLPPDDLPPADPLPQDPPPPPPPAEPPADQPIAETLPG